MDPIRPAAVAGAFYPAQAAELSRTVAALLASAGAETTLAAASPKALIVPHAGYIYSGATAALAYAQLHPVRHLIQRVVLLGPAHRVAVRGLALADAQAFETPLGTVAIDATAVAAIQALPQVRQSHAAHAMEHSLEVQLPFLQTVLEDFTLLPLVVGDASPTEVAAVLDVLWGGPETLIVLSSDLSHYLPYRAAQVVDQDTARHILSLDSSLTHAQACGATPVNGLLLAARHHGLQAQLLGLCNSGDSAGDADRVVGYGAFAFRPESRDGHRLVH